MNTIDNLIHLHTPGPQCQLARLRIALGDETLIYGRAEIASLTFTRDDSGQLLLSHMAVGVPRTTHVMRPGEEVRLVIEGKTLLLIVRAVSATHVMVDAGKDRTSDIAMVLAASA